MNPMDLLNVVEVAPMQFFNPRMSMLRLDVSLTAGSVQVSMADSLNKNHTGPITAGAKMYDHDNSCYFSLSPGECVKIVNGINDLVQGKFVNTERNENEKFKDCITVNHYRENQLSKLVISPSKDQSGNITGTARITIFPPGSGKGKITNYMFRSDELKLFVEFIRHGANDLPFYSQMLKAVVKALKQAKYKMDTNGGNGNGNGYSNGNSNSYNESVAAPVAVDTNIMTFEEGGDFSLDGPPVAAAAAPVAAASNAVSIDSVDDLNFDF